MEIHTVMPRPSKGVRREDQWKLTTKNDLILSLSKDEAAKALSRGGSLAAVHQQSPGSDRPRLTRVLGRNCLISTLIRGVCEPVVIGERSSK